MLSSNKKVFIIEPDMSAPKTGYFAVKFGRGHLDRAVMVSYEEAIWKVFLDGKLVGESESWTLAFGSWAKQSYFIGHQLTRDEYLKIIKLRRGDTASGVDIDSPSDFNSLPPPRF